MEHSHHSTTVYGVTPEQLAASFALTAEVTFKKLLADFMQQAGEPKEDRLLDRKEVCKLLHISLTSLHDKMKTGALPYKRLGRRVLFQESEVMKAIETGRRRRAS